MAARSCSSSSRAANGGPVWKSKLRCSLTADDQAGDRVGAALSRLDDVGRRTNCIADRDDTAVLAMSAAAPAGPLQGEPITVKDWIDVTGFRCSGGVVAHTHRRPDNDAPAIARLRRAGAVVVAKTAVHVDSDRFGRVSNPHDLLCSPSGSSSGDAAAVGAGAVRLGIGSDSGGSIRVPAAWCRVAEIVKSAGAYIVGEPPDWLTESRRITEAF